MNALRVHRGGTASDSIDTALHMVAKQKENERSLEIAFLLLKHGAGANTHCRTNGHSILSLFYIFNHFVILYIIV